MRGETLRLSEVLESAHADEDLVEVLAAFENVVKGSVASTHAAVLLRLLRDHKNAPGQGTLESRVRRTLLGGFGRASAYGDLRYLLDDVDKGSVPAPGWRSQILAGGVPNA